MGPATELPRAGLSAFLLIGLAKQLSVWGEPYFAKTFQVETINAISGLTVSALVAYSSPLEPFVAQALAALRLDPTSAFWTTTMLVLVAGVFIFYNLIEYLKAQTGNAVVVRLSAFPRGKIPSSYLNATTACRSSTWNTVRQCAPSALQPGPRRPDFSPEVRGGRQGIHSQASRGVEEVHPTESRGSRERHVQQDATASKARRVVEALRSARRPRKLINDPRYVLRTECIIVQLKRAGSSIRKTLRNERTDVRFTTKNLSRISLLQGANAYFFTAAAGVPEEAWEKLKTVMTTDTPKTSPAGITFQLLKKRKPITTVKQETKSQTPKRSSAAQQRTAC